MKGRAKLVYQTDETEAIGLPCKNPALINIYENLLKKTKDGRSLFLTRFEKRNVLL